MANATGEPASGLREQSPEAPSPQGLGDQAFAGEKTVSHVLTDWLVKIGARFAFGVSGGGIAHLWSTLCQRPELRVVHCQHESGAAFAATEAHFATDRPVVVFLTTGPGLTNALTGLVAAHSEGAKLVVVSGVSPAARRNRGATQETDASKPLLSLFASAAPFDFSCVIESVEMLPAALHKISAGMAGPGGFVAHLGLPGDVQQTQLPAAMATVEPVQHVPVTATIDQVRQLVAQLRDHTFALWIGFSARHARGEIAELVRKSGARVMCTPRAKGIFPEEHGHFLGVTGFAGHEAPERHVQEHQPDYLLVLGSQLGEGASQWSERLRPRKGIVQIDPSLGPFGGSYPDLPLAAIRSDVGDFLRQMLVFWHDEGDELPIDFSNVTSFAHGASSGGARRALESGRVHPAVLMQAVQHFVVDGSDAIVTAESGNAFAWAIQHLRFATPHRWRVSVSWGAMGHFSAGVVGAALASGRRAVVLVGDGAMLMTHEIATAVHNNAPAMWVVLNDSRYNMCAQGTKLQGFHGVDCSLPSVDFAAFARSLGACGLRVDDETQLGGALTRALQASGPVVLDVLIDPEVPAPISRRVQSLTWQGS